MQDSGKREPSSSRNSAPIILIVLAATIVGCGLGILMADRGMLSVLRRNPTGESAGKTGPDHAAAKTEIPLSANSESKQFEGRLLSEAISTGLSSIGIIRYSPQRDSAQLDFDIEDLNLVRSEELINPDRIYVDLQDTRSNSRGLKLLRAEKTVSIDGTLIDRVRLMQRETGAIRIVLDLKRSCDFKYQISSGSPSRLIVELRPRTVSPPVSKAKSS